MIKHFACVVKYQTEGFLDKNRSDEAKEFQDCLLSSVNELVIMLGSMGEGARKDFKENSENRIDGTKSATVSPSKRVLGK
jgi:myosin heavy subunit